MSELAGTPVLVRLALRHDRVRLTAWIAGMCVMLAGIAGGQIGGLSRADLIHETEFNAGSPALRIFGLASGASPGAYTMLRSYLTLAILAAAMSLLAVVRHTRTEEETGRAELVGAAVIGRHALPAAALVVTVAADVALAVALALTLIATGQPAAGSFVAGCSVGAFGIAFAGVAAITAQLAASARQASGMAAAALGVAFLLSGVGNLLGSVDASGVRAAAAWPAWLSPLGWGEQMRPFGGDRWWPLVLFVVSFAAMVGVAGALAARRDVGRGVLPERRGPAHAEPGLLRRLGLVSRLQRGALLGWIGAMLAFGAIFGLVSEQVDDLEGGAREWYAQVGGTSQLADAFLTSMVAMAGMAVAVFVVQMLVRMRTEEAEGRLEPLLATATGRRAWMLSHVLHAGLCATGLMLAFAVSLGLGTGAMRGDVPGRLGAALETSLAQLPAIFAIGAAVVLVTGLWPRWASGLSWAIVTLSILLGPIFAPTVRLPGWAQDLSPFTHVPKLPAEAFTATPVLGLVTVAAALAVLGLAAFRRRDLALPS